MTEATGVVAIMGSGETSPTMVKTHRLLMDRAGADGGAVLMDTAYGFQENAEIVSARAVEYFRESVGRTVEVASWRSADDEPAARERALDRIRRAAWLFAGPGSPTYALGVWRDTPFVDLLADKVGRGGCVTFASAAALTLGAVTVPVYEIYKVGETSRWEPGLNLLGRFGISTAVIPHFDNAEGGNHDTRYCYLGERRLKLLEAQLPAGAFVLGVDEHTACIIDLADRTVAVSGNGVVTVRRDGRVREFGAGTEIAVDDLLRADPSVAPAPRPRAEAERVAVGAPTTGVLAEAERLASAFDAAVDARDADGAVAAVLALEQAIVEWSRDTLQSDETDRARSILRGMVVRLGELARAGTADPRASVEPFIDAVLDARARARAAGDFDTADALRDHLLAAGVEVRDTADGTEWDLETR